MFLVHVVFLKGKSVTTSKPGSSSSSVTYSSPPIFFFQRFLVLPTWFIDKKQSGYRFNRQNFDSKTICSVSYFFEHFLFLSFVDQTSSPETLNLQNCPNLDSGSSSHLHSHKGWREYFWMVFLKETNVLDAFQFPQYLETAVTIPCMLFRLLANCPSWTRT